MNHNIGYIICETPTEVRDYKVVSDKSAGNRITIECILQDCDVDNRNGRYYASKDLVPELDSSRIKELIASGNLKGENGHPMSKDLSRQQIIDPNLVCCKYLKLWNEGKDIKGLVKGTNNKLGEDFNNDILDGEKPSFSLRALGCIEQVGGKAMVKNIKIITYDRVIFPSHKRAYMQKVVSESFDISGSRGSNKIVIEESDKGLVVPITNQKIISYIKTESANINTIMNNFDTLYDNINVVQEGRAVQLSDRFGNIIVVNLEQYITNEIMNYCFKTR